MKVFITGATGFVGRSLCRQLVADGHEIGGLVRPGSEARLIQSSQLTAHPVDLFQPEELTTALAGYDAVIHLIGIIREFPEQNIYFQRLHVEATAAIVKATENAGIKRYLHMSANGTTPEAQSRYHQTKWLAEELVKASSLNWTIFRPSLIYGAEDHFINMLLGFLRKLPCMPIMGNGEYRLQPVPVQEVAKGFAQALNRPQTLFKTYYCGGADCLSYNQLIDDIAGAIAKRSPVKIKQPLFLMRPVVQLMQHLAFFPMTSDQLQMLIAGNCCDCSSWWQDLDLQPVTLKAGLEYLHLAQNYPP